MSRMFRIRRIGIVSVVTRVPLVIAGIGFVLGLIAAFWASVMAASFTMVTGYDLSRIGYGMLILLPFGGMILAGLYGVCVSFLFVVLYNVIAGLFGGIEVEMDESPDVDSISMPKNE